MHAGCKSSNVKDDTELPAIVEFWRTTMRMNGLKKKSCKQVGMLD